VDRRGGTGITFVVHIPCDASFVYYFLMKIYYALPSNVPPILYCKSQFCITQ